MTMTGRFYGAAGHRTRYGNIYSSPWSPPASYIGTGTIFQRSVPLATNSASIAAWMVANTPYTSGGGFGDATALNNDDYNIPIYIVNSTLRGCQFQTFTATWTTDPNLVGPIPLPYWATPSNPDPGGDLSLALYDVGTGIMREYYGVTNTGTHTWNTLSAGYYPASPGFTNLAADNYPMQLTEGLSSAVVKMLSSLSQIGVAEAFAGVVNHAVNFTAPNSNQSPQFSWPAQQGDGTDTSGNAPCEGQWFKLPSGLTLSEYKPFTQLIITACQTYGGWASDKNLFVAAFNTEPSQVYIEKMGVDPWVTNGLLSKLYAAEGDDGVIRIEDFPWNLTQWAPINWGQP
jgi:hypothetical protein